MKTTNRFSLTKSSHTSKTSTVFGTKDVLILGGFPLNDNIFKTPIDKTGIILEASIKYEYEFNIM